MKKLILTAMLLALPAFGDTDILNIRNGGLNGRFWVKMNSDERVCFVMGFSEAVALLKPFSEKDYFSPVPNGDVVKGVDRFYQEPENLFFPVFYAFQIFTIQANGATQAEVEAKLAQLFRFSWKLSEGLKSLGGLADRSIWSETREQGTPTLDLSRQD